MTFSLNQVSNGSKSPKNGINFEICQRPNSIYTTKTNSKSRIEVFIEEFFSRLILLLDSFRFVPCFGILKTLEFGNLLFCWSLSIFKLKKLPNYSLEFFNQLQTECFFKMKLYTA